MFNHFYAKVYRHGGGCGQSDPGDLCLLPQQAHLLLVRRVRLDRLEKVGISGMMNIQGPGYSVQPWYETI